MKLEHLKKRFPNIVLFSEADQQNYESIFPFHYGFQNDFITIGNFYVKMFQMIIQKFPNDFLIIVTHGSGFLFGYNYFNHKPLNEKEFLSMNLPSSYGIFGIFEKNNERIKLIKYYKNNLSYGNNYNEYSCENMNVLKNYIIIFLILFLILYFYLIRKK